MPMNFSYVLEDRLAGSAHPGSGEALRRELQALADQEAIGAVVSLTETPLDRSAAEAAGMAYLHEPIPDFGVPTPEAADRIVDFVADQIEAGRRVLVHCGAGYGRTGLALACCLADRGSAPEQALQTLRRLRPGSVETREQERFVIEWAQKRGHSRPTDSQDPDPDCR